MASHDLDGLKIDVIDAPQEVIRDVSDTPIIFKCISCGTIVGDSTLWITANGKLRSITLLRATSKVQCGRTLLSSVNGDDLGSAYYVLSCGQCKAEFGKMYKTTPSHLDDLRNRFTFNVEKIDSYQVGCAEQGLNCTGDELLTVPMACSILSKLDKLQSTLTSLERRVSALENTRQSKTVCKHESSVAENDIIEMPGPGVNSLRNSPAQETNQGDSGSLKRRSLAAGIYVTSSPKTSKRAKVHK